MGPKTDHRPSEWRATSPGKGGDGPAPGPWPLTRLPCAALQVLTELKSDNQRLKDENGALIRVISKLSK